MFAPGCKLTVMSMRAKASAFCETDVPRMNPMLLEMHATPSPMTTDLGAAGKETSLQRGSGHPAVSGLLYLPDGSAMV